MATARDKNVGTCDICCDGDAFIVSTLPNICDKCDDEGEPLTDKEMESAYTPEPAGIIARNTIQSFILGFLAAISFTLLALAPFLIDAEEILAFWQGVGR